LVEVASNREGPENAERLYELLGSSEDLIIVTYLYINMSRMELFLKMKIKAHRYGKFVRKSLQHSLRKDM
jgi:hypothetical protein